MLEVGSIVSGASSQLAGKIHRAQLRDGIGASGVVGGTIVADYRADAPMGSRYRDAYDKVWTINGSAWSWMVAV